MGAAVAAGRALQPDLLNNRGTLLEPESTEAMCAGVDTRVDGQGRANRPGQVPIDGDEGGVK